MEDSVWEPNSRVNIRDTREDAAPERNCNAKLDFEGGRKSKSAEQNENVEKSGTYLEDGDIEAESQAQMSLPKERDSGIRAHSEKLNTKQPTGLSLEAPARNIRISLISSSAVISKDFTRKLARADRRVVGQMLKVWETRLKVEEVRLRKFELERERLIRERDKKIISSSFSATTAVIGEKNINANVSKKRRVQVFEDTSDDTNWELSTG